MDARPRPLWSARSRPQSASVMEIKFRAGTHVRHQIWGDGIVLDSRIQDDDEIVDVVFESVGIKRLAAVVSQSDCCKIKPEIRESSSAYSFCSGELHEFSITSYGRRIHSCAQMERL